MLDIGTKVVFADTARNRMGLGINEDGEYTGFELDVEYVIAGIDLDHGEYFYDGNGDRNFACSLGGYEIT